MQALWQAGQCEEGSRTSSHAFDSLSSSPTVRARPGSPGPPSEQPGGGGSGGDAGWGPALSSPARRGYPQHRPCPEQPAPGNSQDACASHRQDCALVVLMEKKSMETIAHPQSQLMGNKSGSKCRCSEGAVWEIFLLGLVIARPVCVLQPNLVSITVCGPDVVAGRKFWKTRN